MSRHRSDAVGRGTIAPESAVDPRTGGLLLEAQVLDGAEAPAPRAPHSGGSPSPGPGADRPGGSLAPDTNPLDLAAIALAASRRGAIRDAGRPPESPALGIPAARSTSPVSGPIAVPASCAAMVPSPGTPAPGMSLPAPDAGSRSLGDVLRTRRVTVALGVAAVVAGAVVAIVGASSAMHPTNPSAGTNPTAPAGVSVAGSGADAPAGDSSSGSSSSGSSSSGSGY